jgi:hypothetical protein
MRSLIRLTGVAAALVGLALTGCNTSSSLPAVQKHPSAKVYIQIERLSRPAIKEVFENFVNHDATNRTAPTQDSLLSNSIVSFMENVAGRDVPTSTALEGILTPDEMQADMSVTVANCSTPNTPCAAYLGIETGGATGNKFGGRWLNDDTVAISLGAIFGNTLSALGVVPDDHHESPCLTTDNVAAAQAYGNTFPYVNTPY